MADKRVYVTLTSYAMTGPADRARIVQLATLWAEPLGWWATEAL